MAYCLKCTADYRPHVTACPECGGGLVEDGVHEPEGPPPQGDLSPVFQAMAVEEIASVRAALEAHDIGSFVENEQAPYLVIGMPTCAVPLRVLVAERDAARAREVIAEVLRRRSQERGTGRGSPGASAM